MKRWKNRTKTIFAVNILLICMFVMSGCEGETDSPKGSTEISDNTEVSATVNIGKNETQKENIEEINEKSSNDNEMKIRVSDGENEVLYL